MTSTILIGLDAFEREKLEVLMGAGRLPNLQRIVGAGFWTRLEAKTHGIPGYALG